MTISMRVLPRFPARIDATAGLKAERVGTDIVISQDFGSLIRIPAVADADKVFFIAWNSDENVYSIMSFTDTFAAVVDVTGLMAAATYDPQNKHADAFARANHTGTQAQSTIVNLATDLATKAPLASPAFTDNPTAPTQTPGNNSTRLATTAYADNAASAATSVLAAGECRLALSGGNLVLSRFNGIRLAINGAIKTIPQAGVSLAPSGLTAGTAYYIYAFMNSGTMTLEASTTVPATDATTGVQIKTGDATRSLVGLWLISTGPAWSTVACQGASWFNPVAKMTAGANASPATTSSATLVELATNARVDFVTFADRPVRLEISGRAGVSIAQQDVAITASVDTLGVLPNQVTARNGNTNSGEQTPFFSGAYFTATAGLHTAGLLAAASGGSTATFTSTNVIVTISG